MLLCCSALIIVNNSRPRQENDLLMDHYIKISFICIFYKFYSFFKWFHEDSSLQIKETSRRKVWTEICRTQNYWEGRHLDSLTSAETVIKPSENKVCTFYLQWSLECQGESCIFPAVFHIFSQPKTCLGSLYCSFRTSIYILWEIV